MVTANKDYIPFTDFEGLYKQRDVYKFYLLGGSTSLKFFSVICVYYVDYIFPAMYILKL